VTCRALFAIASAILGAGCAPAPLRVAEEAVKPHVEGTLLVGEVIRALTRAEVLERYRAADLERAGWAATDVGDGSGVVVSNFRQSQGHFNSAHVLYALLPRNARSLFANRTCGPTSCSFGGDVVTVRVLEKASPASGPSGLNVVESLVEAYSAKGDCYYEDRGARLARNYRFALYCTSLLSAGWRWDGDELVKSPPAAK
jgi:hypothetical protein